MIQIKPKRIRLLMSYGCNAKCFYCHNEGQSTPSRTRINPEFVGKLLDAVPTEEVILSGGEPTLHPRVADIAREVKHRDIHLSMNTNGSLTDRLRALHGLVDEMKFNIDSIDPHVYEEIKQLPYQRLLQNVMEAKQNGVYTKINTPFTSLENALGLIDFSSENGIEIKFIELLMPGFSRPQPEITKLEDVLRGRGYEIRQNGLKRIAQRGDSIITMMRCYCRDAVLADDVEDARLLCREYTDLYITPEGGAKTCIYSLSSIPIYEPVMAGDHKLLQGRFDEFDRKFGIGMCQNIIVSNQRRVVEYVRS